MRTSIAAVCLSGSLTEKLQACADAGCDGVEIMDADRMVAYESPEEIRVRCADRIASVASGDIDIQGASALGGDL